MRALTCGLVIASLSAVLFAAPACGSTTDDKPAPGASGSGGTGGAGRAGNGGRPGDDVDASVPESIPCGTKTCDPVVIPRGPAFAPCCPQGKANTCGMSLSVPGEEGAGLPSACQELEQSGELDSSCPDSPALDLQGIPLTFKGCCRSETNTCGYLVNGLPPIIVVPLGCVDASGLLDSGAPQACGTNVAGSGGQSGAGGSAQGGAGGTPAGGASAAGGAGGTGAASDSGGPGVSGSAGTSAGSGP